VAYLYPDGLLIENCLWFVSRQPPVTLTQLGALADGVAAWATAQLLPYLSSSIELLAVRATDWTDSPGLGFAQTAVNLPGSDTSGIHSANVSFRVRFRGTSAQPRLINSNFIGGLPYAAVDQNLVSPTFATAVRNAYINLIDLAFGFGPSPAWRWVITSEIADGAYRSEQLASRTDFIQTPNPYVSPRRRRITRLRKL
jgi:hypothetical protein